MDIVLPGEFARVGTQLVRVAEMYLSDGWTAEIVTADGRTVRAPLACVHLWQQSAPSSERGSHVGTHRAAHGRAA
jgi:hypothetical protein